MIHISDLSRLKRFNHPTDYTKVAEQIDVIILIIDKENRKLQLGHKQLEEDPWNSLEETFAIGSIHEGTVTRKDDKEANEDLIRRFNRKVLQSGVMSTVKATQRFEKPISKIERRKKAIIRRARKADKMMKMRLGVR